MKKTMFPLMALAGVFVFSLLAAPGRPPADSMHEKHKGKVWADLNLTPDQREKLKALHAQAKEARKQFIDQMKSIREKVKGELAKPQPSKQVLYGYAAEIGALHKQEAEKRTDHLLAVKAILSSEQFIKILEHEWMGPPGPPHGDKFDRKHDGHGEKPGDDNDDK